MLHTGRPDDYCHTGLGASPHVTLSLLSTLFLFLFAWPGKSTLIHLLVGKLQPISGQVQRNTSARVAVFAQHHVDGLDLRHSSVDMMMSIFPGNNAQVFRRHLGCFGITGDLALQPIKNLSGGTSHTLHTHARSKRSVHKRAGGQSHRNCAALLLVRRASSL
jgi:ATPase subunit of ABC transporter with duplicated ATPase domains